MRSHIIRKYLVDFFVYTIVFVLIIFSLDWIFNGVVIDSLYRLLPYKVFFTVWENKVPVALLAYSFGILLLSAVHIFRLAGFLKTATEAITQEELPSTEWKSPEELKEFSIRLREFKQLVRENEKALKAAEQQKNDLIVYLAHDLKTPLTSVIGYLSLLQESPDLPTKQRAKYTGIALDKAYRLEQLINEFFEITRLNLQTVSIQHTQTNLTVLLLQVIGEFYPMFESKNISLAQDIAPDLKLSGDADKLARVFENLLKNAVNYGTENTEIRCTAAVEDGNIVVRISNAGETIPPEKLVHIFDKFYRLDDARQSKTGGTGLGLTIAKQIVELHRGSITVTSADGVTAFTVTLPM